MRINKDEIYYHGTKANLNIGDLIDAGYYLNKTHWNSIYMNGAVPDNVLKEMINMSYNLNMYYISINSMIY